MYFYFENGPRGGFAGEVYELAVASALVPPLRDRSLHRKRSPSCAAALSTSSARLWRPRCAVRPSASGRVRGGHRHAPPCALRLDPAPARPLREPLPPCARRAIAVTISARRANRASYSRTDPTAPTAGTQELMLPCHRVGHEKNRHKRLSYPIANVSWNEQVAAIGLFPPAAHSQGILWQSGNRGVVKNLRPDATEPGRNPGS